MERSPSSQNDPAPSAKPTLRVEVRILPHPDLHHPEGETVRRALRESGLEAVEELTVGRLIVFTLQGESVTQVRRRVEAICRSFLVNPVMETFTLSIEAVG